jgi:hypothetical protein
MLTKKKLASLALAGVMTLSLAAPAFAATSESTTNRSLKVTAAYQAVTINVVVPTTGTVIINPYKLPVNIGTGSDDAKVEIEKQQIVAKPMAIKNQAGYDLDMNITTTTAVTGTLKFATADDVAKEGNTANQACITMYVAPTTLEGDKDKVSDGAIVDLYKENYTTGWSNVTGVKTQVLAAGSLTTKAILTLKAATVDADTGAFDSYTSGGVAVIGFEGSCVTEPKTAWTTKDGATVTIAFTFTPAADADGGDGNT